jgi:hypothetical protein
VQHPIIQATKYRRKRASDQRYRNERFVEASIEALWGASARAHRNDAAYKYPSDIKVFPALQPIDKRVLPKVSKCLVAFQILFKIMSMSASTSSSLALAFVGILVIPESQVAGPG